jgi:hypothetical protein
MVLTNWEVGKVAKRYFLTIEAEIEVDESDLDEKGKYKKSYEIFSSLGTFGDPINYGDSLEVVEEKNA